MVLWETIAAFILGLGIGYAVGHLLVWSREKLQAERVSLLSVALALTVLGAVHLLGGSGILAVFAAGRGLDTVVKNKFGEENRRLAEARQVQELITRFFNLPIFVLLGAALPWAAWEDLGWKGVGLALGVLLLRRLRAVLLLYPWIRPLADRRDALFAGWFGPLGVGSLYYATFAARETGLEPAWTLSSLLIFASVVAYGVTATAFSRSCGRGKMEN